MLAERFQHREEDAAIRRVDGTSLRGCVVQEVEHAIAARSGVVLRGQVVEAHEVKQRNAFRRAFGEVAHRGSVGVAIVEDVQQEVLRADLIGPEVVDVFHHQVPDGHLRVDRGAAQELGDQYIGCVDALVGELTHLVDLIGADDGVLVGHGKGLVGVEGDVKRNET